MKITNCIVLSLLFALTITYFPSETQAKDLFIAEITVGDETVRESTNSILDVTEFFDNVSLEDLFDNYTPNSGVFAGVNFRGVSTTLSYAENSSELVFRVPGRNFEVKFDGGNRDESQKQFEDWLQGEFESSDAPTASLTVLLKILVADSPIDPVAGNFNSLQTRMFLADFDVGITGPFISSNTPVEGQKNNFTFGGEFGYFRGGPYNGQVYNIPINYRINLKSIPKLSIIFDFPITFTNTQTAWSYLASLGIGVQYRPTKWWSLTPMGRIGGVGSFDVGALAIMYSASATNYFHYYTGSTHMGFATMAGFNSTIDGIKIKGWDLSYDLKNYVLRNGGDITQHFDFDLLGNPAGFKFFLNHTKFWGDELYLDSFFDMGFGVVTIKQLADTFVEALNLSFVYGVGVSDEYHTFNLKLTYKF